MGMAALRYKGKGVATAFQLTIDLKGGVPVAHSINQGTTTQLMGAEFGLRYGPAARLLYGRLVSAFVLCLSHWFTINWDRSQQGKWWGIAGAMRRSKKEGASGSLVLFSGTFTSVSSAMRCLMMVTSEVGDRWSMFILTVPKYRAPTSSSLECPFFPIVIECIGALGVLSRCSREGAGGVWDSHCLQACQSGVLVFCC